MAAYASGRSGLAVRVQPGDRGGSDDFNQIIDSLLATRRALAGIIGGEAVYAGGATALADLADGGKSYPAVTLVVGDDAGYPWLFQTSSPTAIEFRVTATAAGAARLYATPATLAGVSPLAADGRYNQVRFVADDMANTAPAHSLLLGSGTITASGFTAYTPASTAPATSTVVARAHAASHKHGGSDELATATPAANAVPKADASGRLDAWLTDASTSTKGKVQLAADGGATAGLAVQANDARLSNARTPTAHAASHAAAGSDPLTGYALLASANALTARNSFTNGMLAMLRDTKFGPPATGTYVAGDWWIDRSDAGWYCVAGGTPGTWEQAGAGTCGTWSGGSAADITAAGSWNGGALLTGYRVFDSSSGEQQLYTYNGSVWLGAETTVPMQPSTGWLAAGYSATTSSVYLFMLPTTHDVILTGFTVRASAACDASNYWTIALKTFAGATLATQDKTDSTARYHLTPSSTVLASSADYVYVLLTKTGAPPNLTSVLTSLTYRYVRR